MLTIKNICNLLKMFKNKLKPCTQNHEFETILYKALVFYGLILKTRHSQLFNTRRSHLSYSERVTNTMLLIFYNNYITISTI